MNKLVKMWVECPQFCLIWVPKSGAPVLWRRGKETPVRVEVKDEWDVIGVAECLRERNDFVVVTEKFGEIYVPEFKREFDLSHWDTIKLFYEYFIAEFEDGGLELKCQTYRVGELEETLDFLSIQGTPVWHEDGYLTGIKVKVLGQEAVIPATKYWDQEVIEGLKGEFEVAVKMFERILKSIPKSKYEG